MKLNAERMLPIPGGRGTCPECGSGVHPVFAAGRRAHWRHDPGSVDRDCAYGAMSEWHYGWQELRDDPTQIEVSRNGHRADAIAPSGAVIEFQHSAITPGEVRDRERAWQAGCWVVDGTGWGERVAIRHHAKWEIQQLQIQGIGKIPTWVQSATWPVWIDLGDRGMFELHIADSRAADGWLVPTDMFVWQILNGSKHSVHLDDWNAAAGERANEARAIRAARMAAALTAMPIVRVAQDSPWDTLGPCAGCHKPGTEIYGPNAKGTLCLGCVEVLATWKRGGAVGPIPYPRYALGV